MLLTGTYATNVYNNTSALIYDRIEQINVTNVTNVGVSFRLYLGATGANVAGTQLYYDQNIPAFQTLPFYFQPGLKLTSSDFLVGGASTANALVIMGMGEQVVV